MIVIQLHGTTRRIVGGRGDNGNGKRCGWEGKEDCEKEETKSGSLASIYPPLSNHHLYHHHRTVV